MLELLAVDPVAMAQMMGAEFSNLFSPEWYRRNAVALMNIIMIDVVLAGDNAIVVGMAASQVAPHMRARVIFWGILGAVVLRILFAAVTNQLLAIVGLTLAGGLLLWVSWKMYRQIAGGNGEVPTPVAQFASRQRRCPNLAIVTASHNPGRYNGIKFLVAGQPPVPDLVAELRAGMNHVADRPALGKLDVGHPLEDYGQWVIARSHRLIAECPQQGSMMHCQPASEVEPGSLSVVVDAMGGAYTDIAAGILASAGYRVTAVDAPLDPDFAVRDPNPANDANMAAVVESVRQQRADVGLALDGDGDRVIFVDQFANIARPEQIAALLIRHCFGRCRVVYDLKCASIVRQAVAAEGGTAIMQPSGHGFIKAKMMQCRAELGVEVSGHHFFGAMGGGDDGLFTALVLLHLLQTRGLTLGQAVEDIGWPCITPDIRIPFSGDAAAAMETIAATGGGTVTRLDGVRTEYEHRGWALARASITEPAVTFRFEADSPDQLPGIISQFLAQVPDLRRQVMERVS